MQTSTTKGNAWTNAATGSSPAESEFDKEMIATDDNRSSPYSNTIYTAWTVFNPSNSASTIKINHSTDRTQGIRGQSFSTPVTLVNPSPGHDTGTNVQTGPNGEVYVCWAHYPARLGGAASSIGFTRSTDGGNTFASPSLVFPKTGIEDRGTGPDPLFNNTRVNDFPAMAVDKSTVHRGRIYIVYAAKENGNGKAVIQLRYSDDQGSSWSAPVTASIPAGRQNWFPWIAVDDTNGDVSIVYYSLDGPSGFATNTYVAYSADGGNSFCNLRVSDVPHTPITSAGNVASGYAGDYIGITAYGGRAYPTWADNRTGTNTWQLYTSPLAYATLTGPDRLCLNNPTAYSIANAAAGASVQWFSSNTNVATIDASGTATGVAQGTVTFSALITNSCGNYITRTKTVDVGSLTPTGQYSYNGSYYTLQGTNFVGYNNNITIFLSQQNNFNFTCDNPDISLITSGNSTSFTIPSYVNNGFKIYATATDNSCITGYYIFVPTGYAYAATPNPASTELTVSDQNAGPAATTDEPFEAELYDTYGKKVKTQKSERGKAILDIRDVPDGLYNLRVGKGKKPFSDHIQIKH